MDSNAEPDEHIDKLARTVLSAAVEVHKCLGPGYLESIYEEALAIEFTSAGLSFARQVPVPVNYKNNLVGQGRLDFLVDGELIVELKAVETLLPLHKMQVLSYLKATGYQLGLLMNFNVPVLMRGVHRIIMSRN